jgi:hypothetical protein
MLIVAGLNLAHLEPRVWDKSSEYYLTDLRAVMLSYAEIHQRPQLRQKMMLKGIRSVLNIPEETKVFLDNGAFSFSRKGFETPIEDYEEFVEKTKPDWKPIPQDFIPSPKMSLAKQQDCLAKTMAINAAFEHDGFVPVIHISKVFNKYICELKKNEKLTKKKSIALGGIVPNLLRSPKALSHATLLKGLRSLRKEFSEHNIHIFGVGGISTLHLAASLGIDSVDSSGWRNRAARGIVLLPGKSERTIAELGSWNGRKLNREDRDLLKKCGCPVCKKRGIKALTAKASGGFRNRATHNLWTLLLENKWIQENIANGTYLLRYKKRIENSVYRSLVESLVEKQI